MKTSDICVIGVIYAIALFFFLQTIVLPEEAQTYPLGLIAALTVLNTLFLIQCVVKAAKAGTLSIHCDFGEIFKGMQAVQFASVLIGCGLFLVMMYTIGYYAAAVIYLVGTLLYFRMPKLWIAMTLVTLVALVYAVFSLFLKVPLPTGILFA